MDRARSKPDIFGILQRQIKDLYSQVQTLRNQNLALPDWIAVTAFTNSWVNFGGVEDVAGYWRTSGGIVMLRGLIKSGVIGTVAFTLPVGFRPSSNRRFPAISAGAVSGYVSVDANGGVTISAGTNTWIDLSPVMFRADK